MAFTPRKMTDILSIFDLLKIESSSGIVTKDAAKTIMSELGKKCSTEFVDELFAPFPMATHISWIDFVRGISRAYDLTELQMIANARKWFEHYDANKNGLLEREEMQEMVKSLLPNETNEKIDGLVEQIFEHKYGPSKKKKQNGTKCEKLLTKNIEQNEKTQNGETNLKSNEKKDDVGQNEKKDDVEQDMKQSSESQNEKQNETSEQYGENGNLNVQEKQSNQEEKKELGLEETIVENGEMNNVGQEEQALTWKEFINTKEVVQQFMKLMAKYSLNKILNREEDDDVANEDEDEESPADVLTQEVAKGKFKLNLDSIMKQGNTTEMSISPHPSSNVSRTNSSTLNSPSKVKSVISKLSARGSKNPNGFHSPTSPSDGNDKLITPRSSLIELKRTNDDLEKRYQALKKYEKELEQRELELLKRERSLKFVMDSMKRKEEKLNILQMELDQRQAEIYDREEELNKLFGGQIPSIASASAAVSQATEKTKQERRRTIFPSANSFSSALSFFKRLDKKK